MPYQLTKIPTGEAQIEVIIPAQDLKTESSWAAARLSKDLKIPGFRPGKMPYALVKREIGETKILEEAANKLVATKLNDIIKKEELEIAAVPQIQVKKLAQGNDLLFTATIPLIPKITLPDFSKIKLKKLEVKVESEKQNQILKQFRQTRAKEIRVSRPAEKGDKVEIDFEVKVDNKVVDGGKAKKYSVILGQNQMLPGFENQLIGLKESEEKEFRLKFPQNYTQVIAGKNLSSEALVKEGGQFKVKVQTVFKRELPELNDEFARSYGAKNLDDLKNKIKDNLQKQAEQKAKEKEEIEIIEKITAATGFSTLPDSLVRDEQRHLLYELETQITQNGGKFDDYLNHIKKSREELKEGLRGNALKRLQTQFIFRKIIIDNKLKVDQNEVTKEIKKAEIISASSKELMEKTKSADYRHYVEMVILNRQVIEWLKNQVTRNTKPVTF